MLINEMSIVYKEYISLRSESSEPHLARMYGVNTNAETVLASPYFSCMRVCFVGGNCSQFSVLCVEETGLYFRSL